MPRLLLILAVPESHQPWAKIVLGISTPIALSMQGQYTVWVVRMSLPIRWIAGHQRAKVASSRR